MKHGRTGEDKVDLADFLPPAIGKLKNPQTDIPRIAKDPKLTALIESAVRGLPTSHALHHHDARDISAGLARQLSVVGDDRR